jgi:hypothetical protein
MAIQTKTLGVLNEDEGSATLQIDYDDALLRLTTVRIINTHPTRTARVSATVVANPNRTASMDGLPPVAPATSKTSSQNLPTGQTQRFNITVLPSGRLDGVDYQFGWV